MENQQFQKLTEEIPETPAQRTWAQRTFGKLYPGSLRGSIFTLLSTAIGTGCLTLPLVLKNMGIILGLLMLAFTTILAYVGLINIAAAGAKYDTYHYPDLVTKTLGPKIGFVIDCLLIFYLYTTIIAYQVILGDFVPGICNSLGITVDSKEQTIIVQLSSLVFFMIPLGLFRQIANLRFVAIFSAFSLAYIALVVFIQFPFYTSQKNYSEIVWANVDLTIFQSFSTCIYAFACHTNLPQIQGELKNTNYRRIKKVATRGLIGILIPYVFLCLFGYLSLLDDTPVLVANRKPPDQVDNDWAMVLGKIFVSLTVIIAVPINLPPLRLCIFKSWLRVGEKPSLGIHVSVTLGVLITSMIIAIVYPNILFLISFMGGVCGGILILILPAIFRIYINDMPWTSPMSIFLLTYNFILFLVGILSTVFTA